MNRLRSWYLLLPTVLLSGCSRAPTPAAKTALDATSSSAPVARVEVIRPDRKLLRRMCTQPGQIEAFAEAPIHARVSGYVHQVLVDIGDRVTGPHRTEGNTEQVPGQVLAELSVPELRDEARRQQAALAQAEARIGQATAGVRAAETAVATAKARIREAEAAAARAQAEAARWRSENERVAELAASKAINAKAADEAREQWQAAEAAHREAVAHIDAAQAQWAEASAAVEQAQSDAHAARAQHEVAQAEFAQARTMLDYATVRAPFDGVIAARRVNAGHLVAADGGAQREPLFVVVQADQVRVFLDVPESDAALVDVGDPAEIYVESLGRAPIVGQVTRSSWSLDTTTRTLRTEVDVPNPNGRLRPGMYVTVSLVLEQRPDAVVLPISAVVRSGDTAHCMKLHDGKAVPVPVQTGLRAGNEVEIVSGLSGDEAIVRTGAGNLSAGQLLEAVSPTIK